jgi:hypothetical protein
VENEKDDILELMTIKLACNAVYRGHFQYFMLSHGGRMVGSNRAIIDLPLWKVFHKGNYASCKVM